MHIDIETNLSHIKACVVMGLN